MVRRFLPDLAIIGLMFLLAVLFFAPATLGGRTIIPADNLYQAEPWASARESVEVPDVPHNALLSDLVLQNYQWKTFIRENLSEGEIPLWQNNQFAGTPFLANGQHSLLYPFSVLYYILPLDQAFVWFTVSQLWLAGVAMYLYLRGIGLGRVAGLVGGLTVEFSSFFIVSTVHPMIQASAAWLPLLLLMIDYTLIARPVVDGRPTRLPWVLCGGVMLGMVHLAGHLEITYYTLLVMGLYALARLVSLKRALTLRQMVTPALLLAGMIALGFGIGAVQFIPYVEAANDSFRAERESEPLDKVLGYSLPPRHVAKFIMPNVYGNPAHHEYTDMVDGKTVKQDWLRPNPAKPEEPFRVTDTNFGIKNYVEGGAYVGILPLLLAVYGVISLFAPLSSPPDPLSNAQRQVIREGESTTLEQSANGDSPSLLAGMGLGDGVNRIYIPIFLALMLVALSFAFGLPTYALLYYGLPGIEQLHTPFRWLWIVTVCLGVLAAFGAEALSRSLCDHLPEYWHTPAAKHPLYRIAKRGGWVIIWSGVAVLVALVASRIFYTQTEPLIEKIFEKLAGVSNAFPNAQAFYSYEFRNVLFFGLMLISAGIVFRVSRCPIYVGRGARRFPIWQLMAGVVIFMDLFIATYDFNTYAKREWLDYTPQEITWLQDRMHESDQPFRIQAYEWKRTPINANAGWRYGLQDLRGYDSLFSQDYVELMSQIAPQGQLDFNRIAPIYYTNPEALGNPLLDYLNVRYILTDWLIQEPEKWGYQEVYVDAGNRVYENLNYLPRAYTVAQTEGDFYPASVENPIQPAHILHYRDTEVEIEVEVDADSMLILGDNYAKGWQAFIRPVNAGQDSEKSITIHKVNGNLRGVKLAPGRWVVRFDYSPASFQLGAFASFVTGMLVIFMALIWLWDTFVSEHAEQDSGRRLVKNSLAPIILNLFNRGIDFAFAFVMLRILGPSNAGIYYYAIVIFGWFDIFTNFGLNTFLTREVSRNRDAAGRYLFNTSLLRIGLALLGIPVLALVLIIRNNTVSPPLDSTAITAILLLYVGLIPNSITTGLSALFYAFEKAEYPAAIATITTLIKVTIGLGVLLLGWGVVGLAGTSIITNLVTFAIMARLAYPLMRANWEPVRDKALQIHMMRESGALMLNHLLATIFFKIDVVLMEAINGVRVVGVYSTSYKWLDAINIIPAFFTMALLPVMSRQAHEDIPGLRRNYILGIKMLVLIALPVAVVTTYLSTGLIGFLGGQEFLPDGAIALELMIWSIPIGWMNSLTQYVLIATDRQREITRAFIAAVSFNLIANLIFLPEYSYRAAAITTIFSELVLLVGFYLLLRKAIGAIPWVAILWKPWVAAGVMFGAFVVLWRVSPFLALLLCPVIYGGMLALLKPFDADELQRFAKLLPKRFTARWQPAEPTL